MGDGSTQYRWYVDRAKTGRAGCKKCKQTIEAKALRMAKAAPSPFGSGEQMMKQWHHIDCMFQVFTALPQTIIFSMFRYPHIS